MASAVKPETEDANYVQVLPQVDNSPASHHEYESVEFGDQEPKDLQGTDVGDSCEQEQVLPDEQTEEDHVVGEEEPQEGTSSVTTVLDIEPIPRLYYTLPRKTGFFNKLRRKQPKTVAEVGIQVEDLTTQQQLERFMRGVSEQMSQLEELCAKQERLEKLSQKISDLVELNNNINRSVVSSSNSTDKLIVAYMEARDELDHMKSKLEESFNENDVLMRRLDEQDEELRAMGQERDDAKRELETSMSRAKDLELNSSFLMEESENAKDKLEQGKDAVKVMSTQLNDAVRKRDKYKKLFVKLKVNSSLLVGHYINELNLALHDNRQVLMNAIAGGPSNIKEVGKQIDNFLHVQQENNRFRDQVEYLSAQLAVDDLLIDEIKEQMDYLTQVLGEYRKAGIEPPTTNAELICKQIDRYTVLMKDKDKYFSERKTALQDKLTKQTPKNTAETVDSQKQKARKEKSRERELKKKESNTSVEGRKVKSENEINRIEENKEIKNVEKRENDGDDGTPVRTVTSHGDTPEINKKAGQVGKDSRKKKKKYIKLRGKGRINDFSEHENKIEATQSMPNVGESHLKKSPIGHEYNYF